MDGTRASARSRAPTSPNAGRTVRGLNRLRGIRVEDRIRVHCRQGEGFEKTPTVEVDGKKWRFDTCPATTGRCSTTAASPSASTSRATPFKWAEDASKGELLYIVHAIPGNCGNGSLAEASKSADASIVGTPPAGFDHWHGLVGAGPKSGHWLIDTAVRNFTLAGPPGNPMAGTKVEAGQPGFMPVCDIR
jgi:hypothetical protein